MATIETEDEIQGTAEQIELPLPEKGYDLDAMTAVEFAQALGVAVNTLAVWRSENTGPAYTKIGKRVFYRHEDVDRWIKRSIVYTKKDPNPDSEAA
jgi:predicted DNA-binding transcriptional regulator AlpA